MYGIGKGDMVKSGFGEFQGMISKHCVCVLPLRRASLPAHHGDLAAHGKTEMHRKNDTPFSSTRTHNYFSHSFC